MWNLAIECSGQSASLAVVQHQGERVLKSYDVNCPTEGSSVQFVAPLTKELLEKAGIQQPALISVTSGPGSFTGLRVGIATAKLLAYAWGVPVAAVDSLKAIALDIAESLRSEKKMFANPPPLGPALLIPVINAYRKQVFTSAWRSGPTGLEELNSSQVVDALLWQTDPVAAALGVEKRRLDNKMLPAFVGGPGLEQYLPSGGPAHSPIPQISSQKTFPPAALVARLGFEQFQRGAVLNADELLPEYGRKSAAEEKVPPKT